MLLFNIKDLTPQGIEILQQYQHKIEYKGYLIVIDLLNNDKVTFDEKQLLHSFGWKNFDTKWIINTQLLYFLEDIDEK